MQRGHALNHMDMHAHIMLCSMYMQTVQLHSIRFPRGLNERLMRNKSMTKLLDTVEETLVDQQGLPLAIANAELFVGGDWGLRATSPVQHLIGVPAQQSLLISPALNFALGIPMTAGDAGTGSSGTWPVALCIDLLMPHYSLNYPCKHNKTWLQEQHNSAPNTTQRH